MNDEEETLLDRAFLITTGHWESHGGQVGCEVCDFNQALLERRKAKPQETVPEAPPLNEAETYLAKLGALSWAQEQRMRWIEWKVYSDNHINRSDLVTHFRISMPQATEDLKNFLLLKPNAYRYNPSNKRYEAIPA